MQSGSFKDESSTESETNTLPLKSGHEQPSQEEGGASKRQCLPSSSMAVEEEDGGSPFEFDGRRNLDNAEPKFFPSQHVQGTSVQVDELEPDSEGMFWAGNDERFNDEGAIRRHGDSQASAQESQKDWGWDATINESKGESSSGLSPIMHRTGNARHIGVGTDMERLSLVAPPEDAVMSLIEVGFDRQQAEAALAACRNDPVRAADWLFRGGAIDNTDTASDIAKCGSPPPLIDVNEEVGLAGLDSDAILDHFPMEDPTVHSEWQAREEAMLEDFQARNLSQEDGQTLFSKHMNIDGGNCLVAAHLPRAPPSLGLDSWGEHYYEKEDARGLQGVSTMRFIFTLEGGETHVLDVAEEDVTILCRVFLGAELLEDSNRDARAVHLLNFVRRQVTFPSGQLHPSVSFELQSPPPNTRIVATSYRRHGSQSNRGGSQPVWPMAGVTNPSTGFPQSASELDAYSKNVLGMPPMPSQEEMELGRHVTPLPPGEEGWQDRQFVLNAYDQDDWVCERCTLANKGFNSVCEVCDASKPWPSTPSAAAPHMQHTHTHMSADTLPPVPPSSPSGNPGFNGSNQGFLDPLAYVHDPPVSPDWGAQLKEHVSAHSAKEESAHVYPDSTERSRNPALQDSLLSFFKTQPADAMSQMNVNMGTEHTNTDIHTNTSVDIDEGGGLWEDEGSEGGYEEKKGSS